MDDDERKKHREIGVTLFNRCWELIEAEARSADDDVEMLLAATTSRWHWAQIGGPEEVATGDWQIAHVASLLGLADLSVLFATRNLATATAEGWDGWRLASAHEGMARACATGGDADGRQRQLALGREALEREPDAENRELISEQLDSVPDVIGT